MLNKTPDMQNAVQNVLLYTKFMNNHNFPGKFQMGLKKKKKWMFVTEHWTLWS